ncbi:MAG: hypothetical protein AABX37_01540 [Nanoarchaeota archaeon]
MNDLRVNLFQYESTKRLPIESYCPTESTKNIPLVILAGMNVLPAVKSKSVVLSYEKHRKANYHGAFPALLASETKSVVYIIYPPAVARNGHARGMYTAETMKLQMEEALSMAGDRAYVITHSLSTLLAFDILTGKDNAIASLKNRIVGLTLSSPFTSMEDALMHNRQERTIFGLSWMYLLKKSQHLPLLAPYPLAAQYWHEGDCPEQDNPHWRPYRWVNTQSAQYILSRNGCQEAKESDNTSVLVIVTEQDKIFSTDKQDAIASSLKACVSFIPSGHRWFTAPLPDLERVVDDITTHYKDCTTPQK